MKKFYKLILILSFSVFFLTDFSFAISHKPINLVFSDKIYKLNFDVNLDLITKIPRYFLIIGEKEIPLDFDQELPPKSDFWKIKTVFKEEISRDFLQKIFVEITGGNIENYYPTVVIKKNKKKQINFSETPKSGYDIDFEKFYNLINEAFQKKAKYVEIPAKKKYSPVIVEDLDLRKKGIKEIIAIGESNFSGSSWSRKKNISVAAAMYNGLIIPKDSIFSFNEILNDVSEANGFTKELVIKGNKTEMEYGGGVCQVSTTVFRAAFFGGLEIKRRRSHSYAVPYYQPQGLDATIYLGVQDFKFKNDSPADILVQTVIDPEKESLKFIFYGTNDDRLVEIEGPFISDYKRAPEPVIEKTDQFPPGERYMASYAHDGFFARWTRSVKKGEDSRKNYILNSNYKPWPARILEGAHPEELTPPEYTEKTKTEPIRKTKPSAIP